MTTSKSLIPIERIEKLILLIRGHKVILDSDLAELYEVEIRILVRNAKRHLERFPKDFMFQLNEKEWDALRSQIGILKVDRGRHRKYRPYVFTEQGVAMLSSVLNSKRAIEMNVQIMRAFVEMRRLLASEKVIKDIALLKQVAALHGKDIGEIKQILKYLIESPEEPKTQIGFRSSKKDK